MRALIVVLLVALFGSAAHADRRDDIKKKIRALRAARIVEELSLDDQASAKLIATLDKYDDETEKLVEKRVELTKKLRDVADGKDKAAADKAVDDAVALQKAFRDLEDRRLADVRKLLTPQQTAKLLIVLPEFEKKIQNQLRNAIQKADKKKGAKNPEAEDDDSDEEEPRPKRARP